MAKRVLVVGAGGREHALIWALKRTSSRPVDLFCAPGNAGIAQFAECAPVSATDVTALADFASREQIDLTMVGPEASLAEGIVDEFQGRGLRIVGPTCAASQLETSKAFAKDFMQRHGIPTARYRAATSVEEAIGILRSGEFGDPDSPVVVKADGLAAGKGVIMARNRGEAEQGLLDLTGLGSAANKIVIEETLAGPEASVLLFSDGKDFRLMPAARDHKRVGEGDTGPNTGGMGSITDQGVMDQATLNLVVEKVVRPTLQGAAADGLPFRGILFVGLMLTDQGPQVLEYNVRFGDPETQAILVRLKTDLTAIFDAMVDQRLGEIEVNWSNESSACIVLAARGYPGKPETGTVIEGLDRVARRESVAIFHAATARGQNCEWLTAGGRVLGITATGATLDAALSKSYAAVADIQWDGMHYRRDIGRSMAAATHVIRG